jgi:hypothetical protein
MNRTPGRCAADVEKRHIRAGLGSLVHALGMPDRAPRPWRKPTIYAPDDMTGMDRIKRGEFYEDCRYHPMLCTQPSPPDGDELVGVSLIDGGIGSCSEDHCGVVRMTVEEAIERRLNWDSFAQAHRPPNPHSRQGWWLPGEVRD